MGVAAAPVRHEEFVDDPDAVRMPDGGQPAQPTEHDGSDELREGQDGVEFVESGSGLRTMEYLSERHTKVIDDAVSQRAHRPPLFIGTVVRRVEGGPSASHAIVVR